MHGPEHAATDSLRVFHGEPWHLDELAARLAEGEGGRFQGMSVRVVGRIVSIDHLRNTLTIEHRGSTLAIGLDKCEPEAPFRTGHSLIAIGEIQVQGGGSGSTQAAVSQSMILQARICNSLYDGLTPDRATLYDRAVDATRQFLNESVAALEAHTEGVSGGARASEE